MSFGLSYRHKTRTFDRTKQEKCRWRQTSFEVHEGPKNKCNFTNQNGLLIVAVVITTKQLQANPKNNPGVQREWIPWPLV